MTDATLPLIRQAINHGSRPAIVDSHGSYRYDELVQAAQDIARALLGGSDDLREARVTFMVPPGFQYVAVQWGIWLAGGIAVPHCISHPPPELEYVLTDTGATLTVVAPEFESALRPLAQKHDVRCLLTEDMLRPRVTEQQAPPDLPEVDVARRAMILYTSGTTSRPKGVVTTHRNVAAQIITLVEAWGWHADDRILNVLPLHHTHGIINILSCALWSGAVCEFLPQFGPERVWQRFTEGGLSLFMAVPTIYSRLIAVWEKMPEAARRKCSASCRKFRLMVSGSAALPVDVFKKWQQLSGHTLLERYGMTEIGMALSNPLEGERRAGTVGQPLPGVMVRILDEAGREIEKEGLQGELQVKGPNVFLEYWRRPGETQAAFIDDWFKTGDIVTVEDGYYRILGRSSVDIIKTGGYKVSALEIEEILRTHEKIRECAVVGVPHPEWGECVCAAITLHPNCTLTLEELRTWGKQRLASYKVPNRLKVMQSLPRNVMGKVTKPEVRRAFEA